jgi:hypothetical protein
LSIVLERFCGRTGATGTGYTGGSVGAERYGAGMLFIGDGLAIGTWLPMGTGLLTDTGLLGGMGLFVGICPPIWPLICPPGAYGPAIEDGPDAGGGGGGGADERF